VFTINVINYLWSACKISSLGLINTGHFGTQYFDKKILQWKDIYEPWISMTNQGNEPQIKVLYVLLPWLVIEIHGSKISFYCNIFLSFYRNILCQNVMVNKALMKIT